MGKRGDSVAAVAKRHGVSATQVAQWNNLAPDARLRPGSTVVVYVPQRPAAKGVSKVSTSSKPASKAVAGKTRSAAKSSRSSPSAAKVRR